MLALYLFITADKSIGYILSPLFHVGCSHLGLCLLNPNEAVLDHRQVNVSSQLPGQKAGLVIAPLPQSARVKRDTNEDSAGQGI